MWQIIHYISQRRERCWNSVQLGPTLPLSPPWWVCWFSIVSPRRFNEVSCLIRQPIGTFCSLVCPERIATTRLHDLILGGGHPVTLSITNDFHGGNLLISIAISMSWLNHTFPGQYGRIVITLGTFWTYLSNLNFPHLLVPRKCPRLSASLLPSGNSSSFGGYWSQI